MATESQFDLWRKDIGSNLRKALEAAQQSAQDRGDIEISSSDRLDIALAAAMIAAQTMTAERIGQLVAILGNEDDVIKELAERVRTGEQVVSRIVETVEAGGIELSDEAMVSITMAEDWLDPEGLVKFLSPEARDRGDGLVENEERTEDDGEAEQGS